MVPVYEKYPRHYPIVVVCIYEQMVPVYEKSIFRSLGPGECRYPCLGKVAQRLPVDRLILISLGSMVYDMYFCFLYAL